MDEQQSALPTAEQRANNKARKEGREEGRLLQNPKTLISDGLPSINCFSESSHTSSTKTLGKFEEVEFGFPPHGLHRSHNQSKVYTAMSDNTQSETDVQYNVVLVLREVLDELQLVEPVEGGKFAVDIEVRAEGGRMRGFFIFAMTEAI